MNQTKKSQIKNHKKYTRKTNNDKHNKKEYKFILVDGTSSAGKSTICLFYKQKNFECFQIDNYWNDSRLNFNKDYLAKVKNKFNAKNNLYNIFDYDLVKLMIEDGLKSSKNILLDHVSQKEIIKYLKSKKMLNKLYVINVFTNLENLSRNLESRRKEGDSRGVFAFDQFANRYIATKEDDMNKIEKINRLNFIKILLQNFKYEFANKKELLEFAKNTFEKMNIKDNRDHWIKLRDEYQCDYLLNTKNKTKQDIFQELEKIF